MIPKKENYAPQHAIYVTSPREIIHLRRRLDDRRTICGQLIGDGWVLGDETVSGLIATCDRCKLQLSEETR